MGDLRREQIQRYEDEHADLLTIQYPLFKPKIEKARYYGYSDKEIRDYLNEREQYALIYYSP